MTEDVEYDDITGWGAGSPPGTRTLVRTMTFAEYQGKVRRVVGYYMDESLVLAFLLQGDNNCTYFDQYSCSMEDYLTVSEKDVKFIEGDPEQLELLYG